MYNNILHFISPTPLTTPAASLTHSTLLSTPDSRTDASNRAPRPTPPTSNYHSTAVQ